MMENPHEEYTGVLRLVSDGARRRALNDCLEIVVRAKADFKSMEATIVLRDVERLIEILMRTRAS